MTKRLQGKVAIITGAGRGIGKAARLFASEGAKVALADIDSASVEQVAGQIHAGGGEAVFIQTDLTHETDVKYLVDETCRIFGRLDILYNNAGVNHFGKLADTSLEDWERVMTVNVRSVFLTCKYAILAMKRTGGGVIVNTASSAALVGLRNLAAYTASKGAVLQLTKNLALDYAADGIRANALCPGVTATEMTLNVIASSPDPQAAQARFNAGRPLGRMADPLEIAHAALFLASDESSFMTGSFLSVDGGYTAE